MKVLSSRCTLRLGIWRTATINCAIYLKYFPLPLLNEIKICNVAQLLILIGSAPFILVVNRMISFYWKSNCMSGTCMVIVWNRQPPQPLPPKKLPTTSQMTVKALQPLNKSKTERPRVIDFRVVSLARWLRKLNSAASHFDNQFFISKCHCLASVSPPSMCLQWFVLLTLEKLQPLNVQNSKKKTKRWNSSSGISNTYTQLVYNFRFTVILTSYYLHVHHEVSRILEDFYRVSQYMGTPPLVFEDQYAQGIDR